MLNHSSLGSEIRVRPRRKGLFNEHNSVHALLGLRSTGLFLPFSLGGCVLQTGGRASIRSKISVLLFALAETFQNSNSHTLGVVMVVFFLSFCVLKVLPSQTSFS